MNYIIITKDNIVELDALKGYLGSEFELKDLEVLKYLLGMEVVRSKTGIFLTQRKYVLHLLQYTRMLGCKLAVTPMKPNVKLEAEVERRLIENNTRDWWVN